MDSPPQMGTLDYHRTVIAYHGCDREVLRAVLDGGPLENSERAYDWLARACTSGSTALSEPWSGRKSERYGAMGW